MERMSPGPMLETARKRSLLVFAVGGRRLAVSMDEVHAIRPWVGSVGVPSRTPYFNALARLGEDVLPVYDLAARLNLRVQSGSPLCLIAKHPHGPIAVCIDGNIPVVHRFDVNHYRASAGKDPEMVGMCRIGSDEVPLYTLSRVDQPAMRLK